MNKIVQKVIDLLDKDIIPWQQPWHSYDVPRNFISGHQYRGINRILLNCMPWRTQQYMTYRQASNMGMHVKKGEHGCPIIFFKMVPDKLTEDKMFPLMRFTTVFNVEQINGIDVDKIIPEPKEPSTSVQSILDGYKDRPIIKYGGDSAYYSPSEDYIKLPHPNTFFTEPHFYRAMFHELAHSTGHESRLKRLTHSNQEREKYSLEELVADFSAVILLSDVGMASPDMLENNAAYIQHWKKFLTDNQNAVISAASKAEKAVDYIYGRKAVQTVAS